MADNHNVEIPLPQYIEEAAKVAAWTVIKEHVGTCTIAKVEERLDVLEGRFNMLLGAIIASGGVGGAVGAGILKLFGG